MFITTDVHTTRYDIKGRELVINKKYLIKKFQPLLLRRSSESKQTFSFHYTEENYVIVAAKKENLDTISFKYSKKDFRQIATLSNSIYDSRAYLWLKYAYRHKLSIEIEILKSFL